MFGVGPATVLYIAGIATNLDYQLDRDGGREVNTRGDDFFAAFDAPTQAVTYAAALRDAARARASPSAQDSTSVPGEWRVFAVAS